MELLTSTLLRKCITSLVLLAASALSCYSQALLVDHQIEPAANVPTHDSQRESSTPGSATQTNNQGYAFPSGRERFKRYVTSTIGPFSLLRISAAAGIEQWQDDPEEWGQGMSGYGKRFASGFGKNAIGQTITYGLDSAMKLDTGFHRSTQTGFGPRLKHALLENITSHKRSGKRVFSVPRFVGVYSGHVIAYETWYPERHTYRDGLRSGSYSILAGFGINLIREFIIKK
jgi:hypothetical protein